MFITLSFVGLSSPGANLFDNLAEKKWTCHQLKAEFDSHGDPKLVENFNKCLSGKIIIKASIVEQIQQL